MSSQRQSLLDVDTCDEHDGFDEPLKRRSQEEMTCSSPPLSLAITRGAQVLSMVLVSVSAAWTLGLMVLWQATPMSRLVHPAMALLWLGAAVQATMLWQGTRTALASSSSSLPMMMPNDSATTQDDNLLQESHPHTATVLQRVKKSSSSPTSSLASFDTGAQGWIVLLVLSGAPIATHTSVFGLPAWVVTLTSAAACVTWWSFALSLATHTASTRRLDWLNTPAIHLVWHAATVLASCGLWHAPQYLLPALWQGVAEKPTLPQRRPNDWCLYHFKILLSLVLFGLATAVLLAMMELCGAMPLGIIFCNSLVAGIYQGMPLAYAVLTERELEAASIPSQVQASSSGRQLLVTTCWVSAAVVLLTTNQAKEHHVGYVAALFASAALIVTAISTAVQAAAQGFPVAFLSTVQPLDGVCMLAAPLTSMAPMAVATVYPSYQPDAVYLGCPPQEQQAPDVESPRKPQRISSYPTPEPSIPLVFEEHAF